MKNWLDKMALRLAYRLIAFTRPRFDNINDDSKLDCALRSIAEVVTRRFSLATNS